METEGKTHEEADELYAARSAEREAKKQAKKQGIPTPRAARTPRAKKTVSAPASAATSPVPEAAAEGGARSPLTIRVPAEPVEAPAEKPKKAPKKAKKTEEPEADMRAQFEKLGLEEAEISGQVYYMNTNTWEVFEKKGEYVLGTRVGTFDTETGEIDA